MGLQDKGLYILHNDLSVGSLLFQDTSWRILFPFPSALPIALPWLTPGFSYYICYTHILLCP